MDRVSSFLQYIMSGVLIVFFYDLIFNKKSLLKSGKVYVVSIGVNIAYGLGKLLLDSLAASRTGLNQ